MIIVIVLKIMIIMCSVPPHFMLIFNLQRIPQGSVLCFFLCILSLINVSPRQTRVVLYGNVAYNLVSQPRPPFFSSQYKRKNGGLGCETTYNYRVGVSDSEILKHHDRILEHGGVRNAAKSCTRLRNHCNL